MVLSKVQAKKKPDASRTTVSYRLPGSKSRDSLFFRSVKNTCPSDFRRAVLPTFGCNDRPKLARDTTTLPTGVSETLGIHVFRPFVDDNVL